jgi:hypothetical protein
MKEMKQKKKYSLSRKFMNRIIFSFYVDIDCAVEAVAELKELLSMFS